MSYVGLKQGIISALVAFFFTTALAGCDKDDPLTEMINKELPPATEWSVRSRQASIALGELQRGLSWDAHLAISAPQAITMLNASLRTNADQLARQGVTLRNPVINLTDQAITITADAKVKIATPPLEVSGQVSGVVVPASVGRTVELRYAFTQIRLTSLSWSSERPTDLALAVPILQTALNAALSNINGTLQPSKTDLVFTPLKPISPSEISSNGVTIQGSQITLPQPEVRAVAFLVEPRGLRALIDVGLSGDPVRSSANPVADDGSATEVTFRALLEQLTNRFNNVRADSFGKQIKDFDKRVEMIIARRFIARSFNLAAAGLDWKIAVSAPSISQPFDSEVRLFKVPDPQSCTINRDERQCSIQSCTQGNDTRDCNECILWGFGDHCIQRGSNLLCEGAKTAQNILYGAQHTTCQADAVRLKGECEIAKSGQNVLYQAQTAACQTGNELVQSLANFSGRVGRVSGNVKLDATGSISIPKLVFLPDLSALSVEAVVQITGKVEAQVSFVQSDLAGHLLCIFPVQNATVRATAAVGPAKVAVSSTLEGNPPNGVFLTTNALDIAFSMRPRPTEALFSQNPDLMITCAGASGLAWLGGGLRALGVNNLPEAITGDFVQKVEAQRIPLHWAEIDVKAPGIEDIRLLPELRINGLVLESSN